MFSDSRYSVNPLTPSYRLCSFAAKLDSSTLSPKGERENFRGLLFPSPPWGRGTI